jgi:hypothetical protein
MGPGVEALGAAAVSGWVVLWSLKQGIEQLWDLVEYVRAERSRDGLGESADGTFVFFGLGVADAAEGVCHVCRGEGVRHSQKPWYRTTLLQLAK